MWRDNDTFRMQSRDDGRRFSMRGKGKFEISADDRDVRR